MKITFNQGLNNTGETESNVAVALWKFFLKFKWRIIRFVVALYGSKSEHRVVSLNSCELTLLFFCYFCYYSLYYCTICIVMFKFSIYCSCTCFHYVIKKKNFFTHNYVQWQSIFYITQSTVLPSS